MSSHRTLDEYLGTTPEADPVEDDPDQVIVNQPDWTDSRRESGVCESCGNSVPSTIQRTLGDNDGCVPACPQCVGDVSRWTRAVRYGRGLSLNSGREL